VLEKIMFRQEHRFGGAANVFANTFSLGNNSCLVSVVGMDCSMRIANQSVMKSRYRFTTVKTRYMAENGTQVSRVDSDDPRDLNEEEERFVLESISKNINGASSVIISDYGKGVITKNVAQRVIAMADGRPVFVSSKKRSLLPFMYLSNSAIFFVMNKEEWKNLYDKDEVIKHANHTGGSVVVTNGAVGAVGFHGPDRIIQYPARKITAVDVVGAGDTFLAALVSHFNRHIGDPASIDEAIKYANLAASVACENPRTYCVSAKEIEALQ
jgi:D-beta-D-heptose 7-phosphate kinase/D-beta-D-heptose 1-phosphate adenosyltransferase